MRASKRLIELFEQAHRLRGQERNEFLSTHCRHDPTLYRELLSLLEQRELGNSLETSEILTTIRKEVLNELPERIGPYEILDIIGQGAMGTVFRAMQENPRREVALKALLPSVLGKHAYERFRKEIAILASLRHRGVVSIYDAGLASTPIGTLPYFTMELVETTPLFRAFRDQDSIEAKLRVIADIADVVSYAHQRGIIHRDLKPGNILVDSSGQPKILDFGIAKILDDDNLEDGYRTRTGQFVGTLAYTSPEQVSGAHSRVGPWSDVYSLGVILYEVLTGRLPLDVRNRPLLDAATVLCQQTPAPLGPLGRKRYRRLEVVVARALAKDPRQRYTSASDFATDVRNSISPRRLRRRSLGGPKRTESFSPSRRSLVAAGIAAAALGFGLVYGFGGTPFLPKQVLRAIKEHDHNLFGISVSVNDTYCAIGSRTDSKRGSVSLFLRPTNTDDWKFSKANLLFSGEPQDGALFGESLSLCGSWLAVASPRFALDGTRIGKVELFRLDTGVPKLFQTIEGRDRHLADTTVALRGRTLVVGSPHDGRGRVDVYRYETGDAAWVLDQVLEPPAHIPSISIESSDPPEITGDRFGGAIAVDGEFLLVAADMSNCLMTLDDKTRLQPPGYAILYRRENSSWQAVGHAVGDRPGDFFGKAIALRTSNRGNTEAAIGANKAVEGGKESGAAYIYRFARGAFDRVQTLTPKYLAPGDEFGYSLDLGERALLVGAPMKLDRAGATFLFRRPSDGSPWRLDDEYSTIGDGSHLGSAVSLDGRSAVIAAHRARHRGKSVGTAFAFDL